MNFDALSIYLIAILLSKPISLRNNGHKSSTSTTNFIFLSLIAKALNIEIGGTLKIINSTSLENRIFMEVSMSKNVIFNCLKILLFLYGILLTLIKSNLLTFLFENNLLFLKLLCILPE